MRILIAYTIAILNITAFIVFYSVKAVKKAVKEMDKEMYQGLERPDLIQMVHN